MLDLLATLIRSTRLQPNQSSFPKRRKIVIFIHSIRGGKKKEKKVSLFSHPVRWISP